jgi:hypothetical protein
MLTDTVNKPDIPATKLEILCGIINEKIYSIINFIFTTNNPDEASTDTSEYRPLTMDV